MIIPDNTFKITKTNNRKDSRSFRFIKSSSKKDGWDIINILAKANNMDVKQFVTKYETSTYSDHIEILTKNLI